MTPIPPPQIPRLDSLEPLGPGRYPHAPPYQHHGPRTPVAAKVLKGDALTESGARRVAAGRGAVSAKKTKLRAARRGLVF